MSVIGMFLFLVIEDPKSWVTFLCCAFINVGNQCQNIALYSLLYKTVEKGTRGVVIGFYNVAGSLGILLISGVGGSLFNYGKN